MALVTMKHIRELGYCVPRLRDWCREHGFNIREFKMGVDSARLRATGDPLATVAADLAEQESQWAEKRAKPSDINTL